MLNMMKYALYYHDKGFSVLPIEPRSKKPAIQFANKPSLTKEEIIKLWKQNPSYNIAIRTTDHFVIDIDTIDHGKDGFKSFQALKQQFGYALFPPTLEVRTGSGGLHLWYKKKEGYPNKQLIAWRDGIDLKAHINNYTLVPPSVSSNGKQYGWIKREIAEAPKGLFSLLKASEKQSNSNYKKLNYANSSNKNWTGRLLDELTEKHYKGARNDTIASLTGKLLITGASIDAIYSLLLNVNNNFVDETGNKAPLPLKEVNRTIQSIIEGRVRAIEQGH